MAYQQRALFEARPELLSEKREDQWFDRKSARLSPAQLADLLIGFANADGGTIVIGVENSGEVSGANRWKEHVESLRSAALDFTEPSVRQTWELIACPNYSGALDHVLVIEVHPSDQFHRNRRGDVFKRVNDENRRLGEDVSRELAFDKGVRSYDGMPAVGATMADLDQASLLSFASRIGVGKDVERALRVRGLAEFTGASPVISWGAVLLFGHEPQAMLPGSTIRVLRYDGTQPQSGTRSNLVFDRRIEGRLPEQIDAAR